MARFSWGYDKKQTATLVAVAVCFLAMLVLEGANIAYSQDKVAQELLSLTLPLLFGSVGAGLLTKFVGVKVFTKPHKLLYLLPALFIAVDNFPFYTYFTGAGGITHGGAGYLLLFALYCLCVGVYEELLFRGVVFSMLARAFAPTRKGLIYTVFASSAIFGGAHLLNIFAGANVGATLLQVVYSTLIGGLCAYVLIKTQNLPLCVLVHSLYDFCGLLLPTLGFGTWQNLPTMLIMFIPATLIGIFVAYAVFTYPERERVALYQKLGI